MSKLKLGAVLVAGILIVSAGLGCAEGEEDTAAAAPAAEAPVQTEPEFDPTTVPEDEITEDDPGVQAVLSEIESSIKKSWNRCNARDVCIPGETARTVECTRPRPA